MKTDVLLGLTAAVQQHESVATTRLQSFVKSITDQALLAETPSCTDPQRVRWSKVAKGLLITILGQMSSPEVSGSSKELLPAMSNNERLTMVCLLQVSTCQMACCLASASLASCSASIFVEHYNAFTVRALDLIRKHTPASTNPPHVWTVVAAAFTR